MDPDPAPLVRGMDPRIRIQIHTKMAWIRNTGRVETKILWNFQGIRLRKISVSAKFDSYKICYDEIHRRAQYDESESLQKYILSPDIGLSYRKNKVNFFKTKKQEKRLFCNRPRRLYP